MSLSIIQLLTFDTMNSRDTIAAISTAFGNAGVAIIRISGSKSLLILRKIFKPKKRRLKNFESHKFYYGLIFNKKKRTIDEVLAVYFKAPKTYTGEDMVEIHCHGGIITARKILDRILGENVRIAKPGEFTERAFLSGKIDLTQAEAIADIIYAKSDKAQEVAEEQLKGVLQEEVKKILRLLLNIYSNVLTDIDYPEEDIPEISREEISKKIEMPIKIIEELLSGSEVGTVYKEGLKVALVGLPNVGKSSLLNVLVKDARAIVTDIPGTTRDILEDQIEISGLLIRLFDTAGITKTEDRIEKEGVERSFDAIKRADIILLVVETFKDVDRFFFHIRSKIKNKLKDKKIIIIRNKIDLKKNPGVLKEHKDLKVEEIIEVSALTGKGIKKIEKSLFLELQSMGSRTSIFITNLRQKYLLQKTERALKNAKTLALRVENEDKILIELERAKDFLEEIIGEKITSDILKKVFSKFCVGK